MKRSKTLVELKFGNSVKFQAILGATMIGSIAYALNDRTTSGVNCGQ